MIRFGVIGLGGIAQRFISALSEIDEGVLVAGASLTLSKRESFICQHPTVSCYASYEECLQDPNVDVVYIALPHKLHFIWTMEALRQHKHVLCEKPIAMSLSELDEMICFAKQQHCFLMEALKTPFYPTSQWLKDRLSEGLIGQLTHIDVNYCYDLKEESKPNWYIYEADQGGALLDIGSYMFYFLLDIVASKWELIQLSAQKVQDVDWQFDGKLHFESGIVANFEGAIRKQRDRVAILTGTKGILEVPIYYRAEEVRLKKDGNTTTYKMDVVNHDLTGEIKETCRCVQLGLLESPLYPLKKARDVLALIMEIRSRIQKDELTK